MKYLLLGLLGLIVGAAAGLALLYFNPLTSGAAYDLGNADRALHYDLPADSLAFVAGERALLPGASAAEEPFWEDTINRAALLVVALNDAEDAPVAVASRLLQASSDTDLLLRGVVVTDHWLLTIPGEGSLFLRADTNVWPFLKQAFIPTWYFGRAWKGPNDYRPTVGPGPNSAVVIGASGRFANVGGSALEAYRLTALDRERDRMGFDAELDLALVRDTIVANGE